jgi:hypothetical protein
LCSFFADAVELLKKKVYFTLCTDVMLLTKIPKKGLLNRSQQTEDEPHAYIEAGVPKLVSTFPSGDEFTFALNGDNYTVVCEDKEQYGKFTANIKK